MTLLRPGRTRRASGWVLFLSLVLGLRLAGIGAPPPEVGASTTATAPTDVVEAAAPVPASAYLDEAAALEFLPTTVRCLDTAPACSGDDLLDADTTHLRLADVADRAADPAVAAAAREAAEALGALVSSGCAGWVDGVAVSSAPPGCDEVVGRARTALDALTADDAPERS